jgi:uncharacterized protein (DUF302 family)
MKLPAVEGLRIARTNRSVENVMERLRALAREKGLTEFAHIDFSADAARSGLGLPPTAMLILGDPKSGTALMISARTVAIDLPRQPLWHTTSRTICRNDMASHRTSRRTLRGSPPWSSKPPGISSEF